MGVCLAYILIMYMTFRAVSKVHKISDPRQAKKVVVLTFFTNVCIFAGSGYLIYKIKVPTEKK